jgi:hypothetical protein
MWPQVICHHEQDDKHSERYDNDDDCLQRVLRNRHVTSNLKRKFRFVDKTFGEYDLPTVTGEVVADTM